MPPSLAEKMPKVCLFSFQASVEGLIHPAKAREFPMSKLPEYWLLLQATRMPPCWLSRWIKKKKRHQSKPSCDLLVRIWDLENFCRHSIRSLLHTVPESLLEASFQGVPLGITPKPWFGFPCSCTSKSTLSRLLAGSFSNRAWVPG